MASMLVRWAGVVVLAAIGVAAGEAPVEAGVELTMYYPVAVGGPLTKIIDGLTADFSKAHPDIKVNAIYAGNYDDARLKALAALKSGQPAQLSVLFSIDLFELVEQDMAKHRERLPRIASGRLVGRPTALDGESPLSWSSLSTLAVSSPPD
jgi:sn-glycerol 3-phosphate transport system substrate-binding protein